MVVELWIDPQVYLVVYSSPRISQGVSLPKQNLALIPLVKFESIQTQEEGELCWQIFVVSGNKLGTCLDGLFVKCSESVKQRK